MKKFMFIAALALVAGNTAFAQSKEELKAIKEATKEAEKIVKKAEQSYEMGIPNQQYGRKETNYDKINEAKTLIDQALANQYTKGQAKTYKVAADIAGQLYMKLDNAIKAGDESDEAKSEFAQISEKLVNYCIQWDDLANADPKKKEAEYKTQHIYYQNLATNPLIQCLQAAQGYSTSDKQEELKLGSSLAKTVVDAFSKSHLFSDFTHDSKDEWVTYAKAFKAQSLQGITGSTDEEVEAAYMELAGTKYETTAYSALCNRYRESNPAKFISFLQKGMEKADAETYPNFAFQLMQHQFNNDKKDDCLKTIQELKVKCPDNENILSAYLMEGQIYFEKKLYDKAEALFAEAVQKFPNDDRAITMPAKSAWMKAQNSGDKKDMQHAIDLFKKLETAYPSETEYWGEPLYILYNNIGNIPARDKYKKYYNSK